MPLCPQITLTPVTVTSTGMTATNVAGVYALDTTSPAFTTVQSTASDAYANAGTAQSTANGKNIVTYSSITPAAAGVSGTRQGDIWWQFSGTSVIGYWVWSGSAWNTQVLDNAVISTLDAAKITSGYISADRIAAGTISADKITTGTMSADRISGGTITSTLIDTTQEVRSSLFVKTPYLNCTGVAYVTTLAGYPSGSGVIISDTGGISLQSAVTATQSLAVNGNTTVGDASGDVFTINAGDMRGNSTLYGAAISGRSVQMTGSLTSPPYQIACTTSTRRNKQQIAVTSWDASPLLDLPIQQFKLNREVDESGEAAPLHYGLMAEDVADAGLEWLIDRDEQGRPDYIYWSERMPQALLQLIQTQNDTIRTLTERIEALERAQ